MRRSIALAHVEFLVAEKYPALRALLKSAHRTGKPDELREMEQQAAAYRAALSKLPPNELDQLYAHTSSEQPQNRATRKRPPRKAAARSRGQSDEADYAYWTKMTRWTIREAAALSFRLSPEAIADIPLHSHQSAEPDMIAFARLQQLIKRALETGTIAKAGKGLCPDSYIAWARRNEIQLPTKLVSLIRPDRSRTLDCAPAAKPVTAKKRDTFLKLIGGMAIGGYGYDPKAARSSTVKEIHDDLARQGVTLDPDTIRHKLKEAATLLADDFGNVT